MERDKQEELEIQQIAEEFQEECHQAVEFIMSARKKVKYQDATNVWLFAKLAQMELRFQKLEEVVVP